MKLIWDDDETYYSHKIFFQNGKHISSAKTKKKLV